MLYLKRNGRDDLAWSPFEAGLDRLFDDFSRSVGMPLTPRARDLDLAPALDVNENDHEWKVNVEIPGIAPEDVNVSVTGNVLTVRGEKKTEPSCEGENCRRTERAYGKFVRTLQFPADVDAKNVKATFRHGVLAISLPKAEEARPKTIEVKVEQ